MQIPFTDFGGDGPELHFLHANGYPPACYRDLTARLSARYHVQGMHLRPLWPDQQPKSLKSWKPLSTDLMHFFDQRGLERVHAVGHSIGAVVTLRAAMRHPERFRAVVLIDPVLFPRRVVALWSLIYRAGLGERLHPLVRTSRNRRRAFDDLETVFRGYRRKDVFRFLDDAALRDYITGMTRPRADGGYELAYSPEWETRIYVTGVKSDLDLWRGLPKLDLPLMILRGGQTDTFWSYTSQRVAHIRPQTRIITVERSTHLLPLERPDVVAGHILEFLEHIP